MLIYFLVFKIFLKSCFSDNTVCAILSFQGFYINIRLKLKYFFVFKNFLKIASGTMWFDSRCPFKEFIYKFSPKADILFRVQKLVKQLFQGQCGLNHTDL